MRQDVWQSFAWSVVSALMAIGWIIWTIYDVLDENWSWMPVNFAVIIFTVWSAVFMYKDFRKLQASTE